MHKALLGPSSYQGSVSSLKWSAHPIPSTRTPPLNPVLVHRQASNVHVLYAAPGCPAGGLGKASEAVASRDTGPAKCMSSVTTVAHFSPPEA
jgi:hypothetical protein